MVFIIFWREKCFKAIFGCNIPVQPWFTHGYARAHLPRILLHSSPQLFQLGSEGSQRVRVGSFLESTVNSGSQAALAPEKSRRFHTRFVLNSLLPAYEGLI